MIRSGFTIFISLTAPNHIHFKIARMSVISFVVFPPTSIRVKEENETFNFHFEDMKL